MLQVKNSTSCCANYSSGTSPFVTAKILARKNKNSGTWRDVTYPNSTIYDVYKNYAEFVEVKNMAYEKYGQNSSGNKCYAKLKITVVNPGSHVGKWRADKSR